MITVRPATARGHVNLGWLDSFHTFSFGSYRDPQHMGFRALRVINEDTVQPGQGFGTHSHADMEIISYVLEGKLKHHDSLGTGSVITPGEVQKMTAGTGVSHSEFNGSEKEPVHFLQIWLIPDQLGITPHYEQRPFPLHDKQGRFELVASRRGDRGSLTINTDAEVYAGAFKAGQHAVHALKPGRHAWVHVARGAVTLNGVALNAGDGAAVSDERELNVEGTSEQAGEVLLFDLA